MSHELRLERLYDATPEEVFDAFVDPAAQERLHGGGQPGWVVHRCESDVRVGGTSTYVMDPEDDGSKARHDSDESRRNRS